MGAAAATPAPNRIDAAQQANAWLFSVLGLMAASLLGALLLIVTGRARRIEMAVEERTGALRHEVAERQRTEEALRDSEQRLQAILDTARVGIVKTDLKGRILKRQPGLLPAARLQRRRAARTQRRPDHPPRRPAGGRQAAGRR